MALHWKTLERLNKKLEDMVDEWHASDSPLTLVQYLRMDWVEYSTWTMNPRAIPDDWESRNDGWGMFNGANKETVEA